MEKQMSDPKVAAFGMAFAISSLFSAVLVVIKESSPGVMAWLKSLAGHHWVSHNIVVLAVFVVLGVVLTQFYAKKPISFNVVSISVVSATILSGLIIFGFFLLH
jgi:hypothetical protein